VAYVNIQAKFFCQDKLEQRLILKPGMFAASEYSDSRADGLVSLRTSAAIG